MAGTLGGGAEAPLKRVIPRSRIHEIWAWLAAQGYQVVGPRVHEGAIVYDEVSRPEDLPVGWTDEQSGGRYRLKRRNDEALFGYSVGPHSWKKFLFRRAGGSGRPIAKARTFASRPSRFPRRNMLFWVFDPVN